MRSIGRIPGALAVWVVSYIFFLCTLVNNFSASHDSIHYLLDILEGKELFHQHHLLYNILASEWRLMFPSVPVQYAIESFTALWGSSALTVIYLFFRNRFGLMPFVAAAGTALVAFSYGVWFYSVNIEVYMPPLFFIVCSLYVATSATIGIAEVRTLALLNSLAILFHQVNILFVIIGLYVIIANRHRLNVARGLLNYSFIGIVIVGGMYFIAGWFFEGHHSLGSWLRWMEGYTVGHGYWQPLSAKTPLHVATGFSHAFVGGHFIFQLPAVQHALLHSFSDHGLTDEIFLSSRISATAAWALTIAAGALGFITILLVVRFCKKYKAIARQSGNVVRPMIMTIVVYSLFFCFWMPEILEFWILQMVLVWMLLIGTLPLIRFPFKIPLRRGLLLLAMLMFSINFFGSLRWLQDINNDWYYTEVSKISGEVSANDLVIVDNEWILKDFVRYYTSATVLATDEPAYSREEEEKMKSEVLSRHGKVFIYRDHRFSRSY